MRPGKGSKKQRPSVCRRRRIDSTSDDDPLNNEASGDNANVAKNKEDEKAREEAFEEKLNGAIDGITEKCAKSKATCLNAIEKAFTVKYVPDFVKDRRMTITDAIERLLRKGKGDEQSAAARLSCLVCVQLAAFDSAESIAKKFKTVLISTADEESNSPSVRAECYWALSMMQFLSTSDVADTMEIMELLLTAFFDSDSADLASLQVTILAGWTLLLTLMAPSDVHNLINSNTTNTCMLSLNQLRELLESPHLELRLAAGEALAVIFELSRNNSEDNERFWGIDLIDVLKDLATDSNRYKAKKDLKQQQASFRDILQYIMEDELPCLNIKFGHESLSLEDWCSRVQYKATCRLLGPSLNIHLVENPLMREIFSLGDRVLAPKRAARKKLKQQKNISNAAAFKDRTRQRNKNRDKRSVFSEL